MNPFETPSPVKIRLRGGKFIEVPATQPLSHRPMVFNATNDSFVSIQNATKGGRVLDPYSLREVASQIVQPSRVPRGQIAIVNSWDITRLSVYLMFEVSMNGRYYTEIMTGYTDHADLSMTGLLDPNSMIYINSHIRVAENKAYGMGGQTGQLTMMNNTNVLRPIVINSDQGQIAGMYGIRPTDVYTGWQRGLRRDATVIDFRNNMACDSTTGAMGLPSNRANHIPSTYLSRILTAANEARSVMHGFTPNSSELANESFYAGTAASVASNQEAEYTSFAVFNMLKSYTSYGTLGCFSMNELTSALGADSIDWGMMEQPIRLPFGQGMALREATHGWGDYSNETNVAHKLSHAIPATVSRYWFTTFAFTAVGCMSMQEHHINYEGSTQMFPLDVDVQSRNIADCVDVLRTVIMPEVLMHECDTYRVRVEYSIGGTVMIEVSLDNRPEMPYAAPNYCDSMSAPTITANEQEVTNNGMVVRNIVQEVFVDNPVAIY
jgi:hypothetical protein